jgi:SAM-dependent methyltransferase
MHESVMSWVSSVVDRYQLVGLATLEVGSKDENGTVRPLFTGPYVGVDMRPGPGVDLVANAHRLPFPDRSFDTVVSTEMLEHDEAFPVSLAEMGRVLKLGGLLVLTMRGNGFPHHAFPHDYWRFMPDSARVLALLAGCDLVDSTTDPQDPGLFVLGRRR